MASQLASPRQLGRYRLLDLLGEGGMGTVYLAVDADGRRVAVKVPRFDPREDPDLLRRFYREARAAARVSHPNLCPVLEVGQADGTHYMAMPYVEGTLLSRLTGADRPWPPGQAAELVRRLALGAETLHQAGVIHRDLKPGNIIVRPDGEPVLMDFGLARPVNDAVAGLTLPSVALTVAGTPVGTPAYMAPEAALGDSPNIGPASDVYSLGVVLYELLTGSRPFEGPLAAVFAQILHNDPRPPSTRRPELGAALNALCLKALAKKPADRFASMAAFARSLACYLEAGSGPRLTCPACEKQLRRPPASDGKRLRCPRCRTRLPARELPAPIRGLTPPGSPDLRGLTPPGSPKRRSIKPKLAGILLTGLAWSLALSSSGPRDEPPPPAPREIVNALGMKLVRVSPGRFLMGSPRGEEGRNDDEWQHEVEITCPFHLGAHEVTVGQFRQFVTATGYRTEAERDGDGGGTSARTGTFVRGAASNWRHPGWKQDDNHSVVNVSWNDAVAFCTWLSRKEGRVYELPSEAEWEYACRAGTLSRFATGADAESLLGSANVADASARERFVFTAPAGHFRPNAWGLYDMHGNAWEWCADWYGRYPPQTAQDPRGPAGGGERVLRGGSWFGSPRHCRSAARFHQAPDSRNVSFGFRVLRRPEPLSLSASPGPRKSRDRSP